MKRLIILTTAFSLLACFASAQDNGSKILRFSNITEASVGFQVGKTTRITSFQGGEMESERSRYELPSPRLSTSFGLLAGEIFYLGPGVAYTFQPKDDNNSYAHQVSAFGQTRLHFSRAALSPFLDFKGGYHFASWQETNNLLDKDWYKWDGFFLEPAIGLSFKLGDHALLNGSLGYQFIQAGNRIEQTIQDENGTPLVQAALNEKYHRFLLSLGFTFK